MRKEKGRKKKKEKEKYSDTWEATTTSKRKYLGSNGSITTAKRQCRYSITMVKRQCRYSA